MGVVREDRNHALLLKPVSTDVLVEAVRTRLRRGAGGVTAHPGIPDEGQHHADPAGA